MAQFARTEATECNVTIVLMLPDLHLQRKLKRRVKAWFKLWGVSGQEKNLQISFAHRMRRCVARYDPHHPQIQLSSELRHHSEEFLLQALCHEAAHAAVFAIHGKSVRPHGSEWKSFVAKAGYSPTKSIYIPEFNKNGTKPVRKILWKHQCPVCGTVRYAMRPVRAWRCAACRQSGLEGRMSITSKPIRSRSAS